MRLMLFALAVGLSSCHFFAGERVVGDGHIGSRDRSVGSFNSVEVSGAVQVRVQQGPQSSVRIETDENLIPLIEVYNNGNTVVIHTKRGYNLDPSREIIAYVTTPEFRSIDVSGACDVVGEGPISGNEPLRLHVSGDGDISMQVNVPKLTTEISGSGSLNLKGQARDFSAEVSGSGNVKCFDLVTENTSLDLSGAADAEVNANRQLSIEVSGAGNVQYKGNASVSQSISGAGSVKKVG